MFLQVQNFFFHGGFGDQFVDKYRPVLADTMGPVGRLIFCGRVPPGVVVNDRVCSGQVEARAASFQTD